MRPARAGVAVVSKPELDHLTIESLNHWRSPPLNDSMIRSRARQRPITLPPCPSAKTLTARVRYLRHRRRRYPSSRELDIVPPPLARRRRARAVPDHRQRLAALRHARV